jgi:hypothetical protein
MISYSVDIIDGKYFLKCEGMDFNLLYKYRKQIRKMCGIEISGWDYK